MKKKTLLIAMRKSSQKTIQYFASLPYDKVCLLDTTAILSRNKKVEVICVKNHRSIIQAIDEIYKKYPECTIVPDFVGDINSRYAIRIFNKTFGSKIPRDIFKKKDAMQQFLGDISQKKIISKTYKSLLEADYEEISKKVAKKFIVKPIDASSSISTFKIESEDDFLAIKRKLVHSYNYILEEYIGGELYSLDLFSDGENLYILNYAREVAMIELYEKNKFSKPFLEKYDEEIQKHFNFILPLTYNINTEKFSKRELAFSESIHKKLGEIQYRGIIHLEYKYDKQEKKIGFLEWGARYGGYRRIFMKQLYNASSEKLGYDLLIGNDNTKFRSIAKNIFVFKEREHDKNLIRIKTNFTDTTTLSQVLKKTGDMYKISFESFIEQYLKEVFQIKIQTTNFFIKFSKNYNFFPFYKGSDTKFDYIITLDDENFAKFKKKKFRIIEKIFFHDYT